MNPIRPPDRTQKDMELRRLAQGWRRAIQVFERIRRQEEGRPVLELSND